MRTKTMNNKDIVEKKCDVDRCDATGRCSLDKCFYEEEEEEKVYKCSDCDLWVTSTESCCEEEEEEEEELDKCGYTGGMIEDFVGCGDLIDPQDTSMLGNTSYCIKCYEKHETTYYDKNPIEE